MAADSQFTHQGLITKGTKIFRVGDDIIGFCGEVASGLSFVEWKRGKVDKPVDLDDDFEALVLSKNGKLTYYGAKLVVMPVTEPFSAVGSGSHLAIGAMHQGATPEEAVKIACKVDTNSCLPVKTIRIKKEKKTNVSVKP